MQLPQKSFNKDDLGVILCVLKTPIFVNFVVNFQVDNFSQSAKNMFFSLRQRPLQATYGKSKVLRL